MDIVDFVYFRCTDLTQTIMSNSEAFHPSILVDHTQFITAKVILTNGSNNLSNGAKKSHSVNWRSCEKVIMQCIMKL